MSLIIGSKALKYNFPNLDRECKDIDIICNTSDIQYYIDFLKPKDIKYNLPYSLILKDIQNKTDLFNTDNVEILISNDNALSEYQAYEKSENELKFASKETLFSIKKAHIHFPIKFQKHIKDYCLLYDELKGIDVLKDITKKHFSDTEERLGKLKTPSLKKSVKSFFDQSNGFVTSYFIHDDIHRVMSHYDSPLYERMQSNKDNAICDKNLWEKFSFEDKCKCVLEEAMVIAIERKLLPMIFGQGPHCTSDEALEWSMMRICTTLCSGWFRQFGTDNYFRIYEYVNKDYFVNFLQKYKNGEIKKIKSNVFA
jgi:hypothetical protein